ncbi:MAG: hypothetical protein R3E89_01635 [Thiolinea sp.]
MGSSGLQFAATAVQAGALAVLYEPEGVAELPVLEVPCIAIAGLARQLGALGGQYHDEPSRQLAVLGVTGTDGKTSVTPFSGRSPQCTR